MPKRRNGQLTAREQAFIDEFLSGEHKGNATKAAIAAGYKGKNARFYAARLISKANIQAALAKGAAKREQRSILSNDRIDELLSSFAEKASAQLKDRIAAVKELNRVRGRASIKHQLSGKVTLEQVLTESWGE